MKYIKKLPENFKYDIIGDIHGEYDFLINLITKLGYDMEGNHPENRKIIFLGDFVDRGPKTVSTIFFIKKLITNQNALAILGNHEINTLNLDFKPGASWFFGIPPNNKHEQHYEPCEKASDSQKEEILEFLNSLPLVLENNSIRLVHAAWHQQSVDFFKIFDCNKNNQKLIKETHSFLHENIQVQFQSSPYYHSYIKEKEQWHHLLHDIQNNIPYLAATAEYQIIQSSNPFKFLTCGYESKSEKPFFIQKWRFVQRHPWWDNYSDNIPVIIGHYWRRFNQNHPEKNLAQDESLFEGIHPLSYFGQKKNVFCIDYAIGLMYAQRNGKNNEHLRLAAFRFPEQTICFDNGEIFDINNKLNLN